MEQLWSEGFYSYKCSAIISVCYIYNNMKILHVVADNLLGGAARGAYNLHCGLIELGVDSKMLIQNRIDQNQCQNDSLIYVSDNKYLRLKQYVYEKLERLVLRFYPKREKYIHFSLGLLGLDLTKFKCWQEADIIHLHWTNKAFVNLALISKIKKPVVWTFRDMWPFTGGCHIIKNCEKYLSTCGNCPKLGSLSKNDLSSFLFKVKKRKYTKNIFPVVASNWMKELAEKSPLFPTTNIKVCANSIDIKLFFPEEKKECRKALDLPLNKKIILFGAWGFLKDKNKGYDLFLQAINDMEELQDKYFVFFGNKNDIDTPLINSKFKSFGLIKDDAKLRLIYSASDAFVFPSRQESFGKTLTEALACGTPVVAFNATGPKDIITHKQDGYLAEPYNSKDLANGINWLLENSNKLDLPKKAREKVEQKYSNKICAQNYVSLYKSIEIT
jgi:glycosyltransferase involved in cell wall biosynthesis